jgi:hypothetical protein
VHCGSSWWLLAQAAAHLLGIRVVVDEARRDEAWHNKENHTERIVLFVVRMLILVPNQVDRRVGRRQEHHFEDGVVHLQGSAIAVVSLHCSRVQPAASLVAQAQRAHRSVLPQASSLRKLDEPHRDQVEVCADVSGSELFHR